jgi:single stranded DNA-binding protein
MDESGPEELLHQVRTAEAADPEGRQWPRTKRSDDATAVYLVAPDRLSLGRAASSSRGGSLVLLPLAALRHATASTVPRFHGQADRPARHSGGQHHDRGQRELRRQPHRPARAAAHRERDRPDHVQVAISGRREQEASFFTVVVWRDQAEHAAESLRRGSRVVVVGWLQQRAWTAEDGSARQVVEVVAEELGPSLRWATATVTRATRGQEQAGRWPGSTAERVHGLPAPRMLVLRHCPAHPT